MTIIWLIFEFRFWFVHISFVLMVNFSQLLNSQRITFPTQSCLVIYFLLCSFSFTWFTVLSLSPQSLRQQILLRIINFCFDIIRSYSTIFPSIKRSSVSSSHLCRGHLMSNFLNLSLHPSSEVVFNSSPLRSPGPSGVFLLIWIGTSDFMDYLIPKASLEKISSSTL